MTDFSHLHLHNEYSVLDGVGTSKQYVYRAKELGQTYLGLSNHGNVDGVLDHQKQCKVAGIKPIAGCELYVVPDMHIKTKGEKRYHATVLVENQTGWKNLLKLLTIANLEGFYHRPRVDLETLAQHLEGLVLMTGCSLSFLNMPGARKHLRGFVDILGPERVYLEVMPHQLKEQQAINEKCLALRKHYGLRLVATNDCHYPSNRAAYYQEVLLAIQSRKKMSDKDRWKFSVDGFYLKSKDEMVEAFKALGGLSPKQLHEAFESTMMIAGLCKKFEVKQQAPALPSIGLPSGQTDLQKIQEIVQAGFESRILEEEDGWLLRYQGRIEEELALIRHAKFERYFLIVWDLINWCRNNNVLSGPGRGCFTPGQKVLLHSGEYRCIEEITPGDCVVTHLGGPGRVKKTFTFSVNEPIVKIVFADGRTIQCTSNHEIYSGSGWKCARELKIGDKVKDYAGGEICSFTRDKAEVKDFGMSWSPRKNIIENPQQTSSLNKRGQESKSWIKGIGFICLQKMSIYSNYKSEKPSGQKVSALGADRALLYLQGGDKHPQMEDCKFRSSVGGSKSSGGQRETKNSPEKSPRKRPNAFCEENYKKQQEHSRSNQKKGVKAQGTDAVRRQLFFKVPAKGLCEWPDKWNLVRQQLRAVIFNLVPKKWREGSAGRHGDSLSARENLSSRFCFRRENDCGNKGVCDQKCPAERTSCDFMVFKKQHELQNTVFKRSGGNGSFECRLGGCEQPRNCVCKQLGGYAVVKEIREKHYVGKVHDLEVEGVHSYNIGGLAVHNSVGGSLVAYLMGITDVDPIKYDLSFARFISSDRCFVPDTKVIVGGKAIFIKDVKAGDNIPNKYGVQDTVKAVRAFTVKEPVLKIFFEGKFVVCTKDHKWIVLDEHGNIVEKAAGDLVAGKDNLIRIFDEKS